MQKTDIIVNPEFSYELALVIPHANWLQQRGQLGKVVTSIGMAPFYYFADDVVEHYTVRTVDNGSAGMNSFPNNWIHHNAIAVIGRDYSTLTAEEKVSVNGVLDYSQWTPPNYKEKYGSDSEYRFGSKFIVVCNRYNYEHGKPPRGYFNLECLGKIFSMLTTAGYHVIYKRPENTEFPPDENERMMLGQNLVLAEDVPGYGVISDKEYARQFAGVTVLDDFDDPRYTYNEKQLRIFSNAAGFISMAGGNGIFCSYFGVPNVTYVTTSGELRDGYFGPESYYRKLSGAEIYAVRDPEDEITFWGHNYSELYKAIQTAFL